MDIELETVGTVRIVVPIDRIDSKTAKAFEESLMGEIASGNKAVLVDFIKLTYISSAGLRVLLMAAKRLKAASGGFSLCSVNANIREVLDVSGFSKILDIQADRAAGLAKLGG
jgi:anti-anti-sigma factor